MANHLPTIHNGGTAESDLILALTDAAYRLRKVIDSLRETAPNGRDFIGRPAEDFARARAVYDARRQAIEQVINGLDDDAVDIMTGKTTAGSDLPSLVSGT